MSDFYFIKACFLLNSKKMEPVFSVLAGSQSEAEEEIRQFLLEGAKKENGDLAIQSIQCIGKK